MMVLAKGLEALGLASVMLGLVQGIASDDMWIELYLSIAGVLLFLLGWSIEKWRTRGRRKTGESPGAT